jgi:hypothetical protein
MTIVGIVYNEVAREKSSADAKTMGARLLNIGPILRLASCVEDRARQIFLKNTNLA